jgi:F-type H+-transporting ATPase subunit epsilon
VFTLSMLTPKKKLLTDVEVEEVIVPSYRGQLDILPGHAPLVSILHTGILRFREKGQTGFKTVALSWGYLEVNPTGVIVLADNAEWKEEVDKNRAKNELEKAVGRLKAAGLTPEDYTLAYRKIAKEQTRLDI